MANAAAQEDMENQEESPEQQGSPVVLLPVLLLVALREIEETIVRMSTLINLEVLMTNINIKN